MVYLAAGYQTDFMSPNSPDNTKSTATEERANSTERSAFEQQLPALSDALSKWYLARLRRRAHQAAAGANLTPAALIAADRERVEKMIVDNATETGIKRTASMPALPPSNPQSKISLILPALIVVFQLLAAVSLFVPALSAMQIPAILCVVSLICAAMSLFTQLKLKKRLDDLRDETFGDEVNVEELERIDVIECIRYLFTRRDTIIEELREKEKAIVGAFALASMVAVAQHQVPSPPVTSWQNHWIMVLAQDSYFLPKIHQVACQLDRPLGRFVLSDSAPRINPSAIPNLMGDPFASLEKRQQRRGYEFAQSWRKLETDLSSLGF